MRGNRLIRNEIPLQAHPGTPGLSVTPGKPAATRRQLLGSKLRSLRTLAGISSNYPPGVPVLRLIRVTYDQNERPVETMSTIVSDLVELVYEAD